MPGRPGLHDQRGTSGCAGTGKVVATVSIRVGYDTLFARVCPVYLSFRHDTEQAAILKDRTRTDAERRAASDALTEGYHRFFQEKIVPLLNAHGWTEEEWMRETEDRMQETRTGHP